MASLVFAASVCFLKHKQWVDLFVWRPSDTPLHWRDGPGRGDMVEKCRDDNPGYVFKPVA